LIRLSNFSFTFTVQKYSLSKQVAHYLFMLLKTVRFFCFIALSVFGLSSCVDESKIISEEDIYRGPMAEAVDIETLYSDSARIRIKLRAHKQLEFENGNREFPEGIFIEFYNEEEKLSTTLKANHAVYEKASEIYTGTGDVVVVDKLQDKQLNTEKLNWSRRKREVYTDNFVKIQTPDEVLMGEGLTADEDFSKYVIHKPTGTFSVKE
jgi:LPS export ABC transporter protein LptC